MSSTLFPTLAFLNLLEASLLLLRAARSQEVSLVPQKRPIAHQKKQINKVQYQAQNPGTHTCIKSSPLFWRSGG